MDTQFTHVLPIPVSIGTKVYTFYTDCCDACLFRNDSNTNLMRCSYDAPCHTKVHSVFEETLNYDNVGRIVNNWGVTTFATQQEASAAAQKLIEEHRKIMESNGFEIAEDGSIRKE